MIFYDNILKYQNILKLLSQKWEHENLVWDPLNCRSWCNTECDFVDVTSALVMAHVSGSTVRCHRVSTLWWLSQWRTSWSQHVPGWQRNSCTGSIWAWVSFSATAVCLLTTEAGHGRGGWWTDVLMLCCLSIGVFYGGVCIGMAGVASLMGNILQVNTKPTFEIQYSSFSLYQRHPLLITDSNDTLWNTSSTGSVVYIWYDQWTSPGPLYAGHVLPLCELHCKNVHLNVLITTFQVSFCASFSTNNHCLKSAPSYIFQSNCLRTVFLQ